VPSSIKNFKMNNSNFPKSARLQVLIVACIFFNGVYGNAQALFQENSNDWNRFGDATWEFSNNELVGSIKKGAGFAMTQKAYSDFVLTLEFKPDSTINSGVYIRCNKKAINTTDCYEVNIWDSNPNQNYRTGALVTKSNALAIVETHNKWNTCKIRIDKDHIQVWVNNILTTDTKDQTLTGGYIGLQALGSGEIKFRNIKIEPLK
jgi:hypothetical protein